MSGYLHDLWEFTSSTALWTWISGSDTVSVIDSYGDTGMPGAHGLLGVQTAGNEPGSRYSKVSGGYGQGRRILIAICPGMDSG